jgi:hypothetical protein
VASLVDKFTVGAGAQRERGRPDAEEHLKAQRKAEKDRIKRESRLQGSSSGTALAQQHAPLSKKRGQSREKRRSSPFVPQTVAYREQEEQAVSLHIRPDSASLTAQEVPELKETPSMFDANFDQTAGQN